MLQTQLEIANISSTWTKKFLIDEFCHFITDHSVNYGLNLILTSMGS